VFGTNIRDVVVDCNRNSTPIGRVVTNPNDPDTDNDRLSDGKEVNGFRVKQKVIISKDGKRTYNIGKVHTNPLLKDTDSDGINDKKEKSGKKNKQYGKDKTDPRNCDTDLGGNSDGKEIRKGSNPADRASSPKNPKGKP
jgi:hypothetical protein